MTETTVDMFERAALGDSAALRGLLKEYGAEARKAVRGKIGQRWQPVLDESDVMQVAYMEAFMSIDRLEARDPTGFVAWLTRIAENSLRDAIRGLSRKKRPQPQQRVQAGGGDDSYATLLDRISGSGTTPSHAAAGRESVELIEQALGRLPQDYNQVVRLYDLEGLPAREVATAMGRSEGAVYMLRARAHDRLREQLGTASNFLSSRS